MEFRHFAPSEILKPYVKHYYLFESESGIQFEDTVFPSGNMEVIFNLGDGTWQTMREGKFSVNPNVELWGQITKPLEIRSAGKHIMLGIRFFAHTAACFFNDDIGPFNDVVSDFAAIVGEPVKTLHSQLSETGDLRRRLEFIECFLLKRLIANDKKSLRMERVANILTSIKGDSSESNLNGIASAHGISQRYLHKLISQQTGLSPTAYGKINRFQYSLKLIARNDRPFTTIAYDCGYFDQSHFIRDFKSFTGITPSVYLDNITPVNLLLT